MDTKREEKTELQDKAEPLSQESLSKKIDALIYVLTMRFVREKKEDDAAKQ